MEYKKPELILEKFTFEPVMAEPLSGVSPTPPTSGPIIGGNDPFADLGETLDDIINFGR